MDSSFINLDLVFIKKFNQNDDPCAGVGILETMHLYNFLQNGRTFLYTVQLYFKSTISYRIILIILGKIEVSSKKWEMTHFAIMFPVAKDKCMSESRTNALHLSI